MRRRSTNTLLGVLAIALLSAGCDACGGAGSAASTTTRRMGTSALVAPVARDLSSDYDGDDYGRKSLGGDADDDDIGAPTDRDGDTDNGSGSYYDGDDSRARDFGHAADTAERTAITALVKRYYTAIAAQDGAAACPMVVSAEASSVPETLGRPGGPPNSRGKTCAVVMSKVFALFHKQLSVEAAELEVTGVRVKGNEGVVVLGFKSLPGRQIGVAREGGVWKVTSLVDSELP